MLFAVQDHEEFSKCSGITTNDVLISSKDIKLACCIVVRLLVVLLVTVNPFYLQEYVFIKYKCIKL